MVSEDNLQIELGNREPERPLSTQGTWTEVLVLEEEKLLSYA